eukprot:6457481-Amphidinium_carterae.1
MARAPGQCYSLAQNVAKGFGAHSTPQVMHCLIKNVGVLWTDVEYTEDNGRKRGRPVTCREVMLLQGLPMSDPEVKTVHCSFQVARNRKRTSMLQQVGNSMHVNAVGVALVFALGVVQRPGHANGLGSLAAFVVDSRKAATF